MIDVDGYVRVSTEEQSRDGVSIDAQKGRIHGYHDLYGRDEENPFRLRRVVVDAGVSAKTMDRPGLRQVLADLDSGAIGGVIIAKLDRLTRSLADWSALIDRYFCEKKGRRLIGVDNQINTMTANGRLMLNLIVMIAQWEREIIAERTKEALRYKIDKGERVGKVRFGYRVGPDGKTLVPMAREQEAIAVMKLLTGEGKSLRAVARYLEDLGIETSEGGKVWSPWTIQKILKRTA